MDEAPSITNRHDAESYDNLNRRQGGEERERQQTKASKEACEEITQTIQIAHGPLYDTNKRKSKTIDPAR